MSRSTIDYGIDLGTTNSSIAVVAGAGTEIIKNNLDADVTPSAIYINRQGNLWVGQSARSKLGDERAEDDLYLEFKRRMGTGFEYAFRSSGRRLEAEELSAEVLKSLRGDVAQKKGEDIAAAVITVPAAFELHQCEATKKAATLAGFSTAALLQEPVAAALAYGFQKIDAKAYWLIFDFGGGTFDAALIRSEHGSMSVVNHGGDNFLGGSDLDWAIVSELVAPRVARKLGAPDFRRGTVQYRQDFVRLKAAAEAAKIELSRSETTPLEVTLRNVAREPILFETELTRADVAKVAEPVINRALDIARKVLAEKRLAPSAVEKLIFVGGPTLAPYFRGLVGERLGVAFDFDVDPMTVVARGAAIFASTQPLESAGPRRVSRANRFSLELVHKPVGAEPDPLFGGRVLVPPGGSVAGYTLEILNQHSKWRSGRILLGQSAAFQLALRAEIGLRNPFAIELRDTTGNLCEVEPDTFHYTVGVVVDEQPIINNVGVATTDNRLAIHFTKGQGLPARSSRPYRTVRGLGGGESGSVIRIPIIEGNRELADRNILIGSLDISGEKIKRDLPVGSEVEVTFTMDTSRILHVVAYVPLLDEEFPVRIELGGKVRRPDPVVLRSELAREKHRLAELGQNPVVGAAPALRAEVGEIEVSPALKELETTLNQEQAEFDALLQAERSLLEFKVRVDEVAGRAAWPLLVQGCETRLAALATLAGQNGTAEEQVRVGTLREQVRELVAGKDADRLRVRLAEIQEVSFAIQSRQASFWIDHFENLARFRDHLSHPGRAVELIRQGRTAIERNDIEALKTIIYNLQDLLPPSPNDEAPRGYGSSVIG